MPSPSCGLLSVAHGGTGAVVFVEDGSSLLRDPQVPKYASHEKDHLTSVICGHKIGFSGGTHNGWLEFAFVCNGASCKTQYGAAKGAARFHASGPVGIGVLAMHNICVIFGLGHVQEQVLFVAINSGEGTFFEFWTRGSTPVIETVGTSSIKILKCMLHAMVVVVVWAAVCL